MSIHRRIPIVLALLFVVSAGSVAVGAVGTAGPPGADGLPQQTTPAAPGGTDTPAATAAPGGFGTPAATAAPGGKATAAPGATACDYERVFDEVIPSVVTLRVSNASGDFALGSGWVYDRNDSTALVVTNWHVVANATGGVGNATGIDLQFSRGEWRTGTLVGADPATDLAVVAVQNPPSYADPLTLSKSSPEPGQELADVGAPLGLSGSISRGIVSAVNRSVIVQIANGSAYLVYPNTIQFDAAAPGGSSGSPVVDCRGRVMGVQAAGATGEDVNFAITGSVVRQVIPVLVERGAYQHSFLGIDYLSMLTMSPTLARVNDVNVTRGVLVVDVVAGSPADGELRGSSAIDRQTGLPVGGDVVVAIDGTPIDSEGDLVRYLFERTRPGDTVAVTVVRNGERRTVDVTLGARPRQSFTNATTPTPGPAPQPTPTPGAPPATQTAAPPGA